MKGFIEEYGKIIVVIILTLLMLGFGQTGLAKPIQNSLLKSTGMITNAHNKFDEVTKEPEPAAPGTVLDIDGTKYIVLEKQGNNQALVMTASSIGDRVFQSGSRSDELAINTYENSTIDNYLENDWYNSLSPTMKAAIQTTNIKQASYASYFGLGQKQETGYNGQVYNTINRHVFLPSVSEIGKVVGLNFADVKNEDKVKAFLNGVDIWTRDSYQGNDSDIKCLGSNGYLNNCDVSYPFKKAMRPAFVIDLSKVDYTEAGHVDYK